MGKNGPKVPSFSHYAQSYEQLLCKQASKLCKQTVKKSQKFFKKTLYKKQLLHYNK